MKSSLSTDEPTIGSWVYASISDCPTRVTWERLKTGWRDPHGCLRKWNELIEPIDTFNPNYVD